MSKIVELVRQFADLQTKHEEQKEVLDKLNDDWSELELRLLDAMVDEGVKSTAIDGLGQFTMVTTNRLSVTNANKPIFFPYLKEAGHGDLLREDVPAQTLTAFLKGHLEEIQARYESEGMDKVDARDAALKFLNEKGAAYFSKKEVRWTKK